MALALVILKEGFCLCIAGETTRDGNASAMTKHLSYIPRVSVSMSWEATPVTVDQNFFSAGWLFNVMETINSILRSNNGNKYLLCIYESIDKAMSIKARDRESIK